MRLFVALEPPETITVRIRELLRVAPPALPAARWVRPQGLHVTLVFLGEVPASALPALQANLGAALVGEPAPRLQLCGAGAFPSRRRARVLWLAVEADRDLTPLHAALAKAARLAGADLETAGAFHPHLTLARCSRAWPASAVDRLAAWCDEPAWEAFTAREAVLFESHLGAGGARYEALARLPFAEAA